MSGFSTFRFAILDFQIRNQTFVNPQLNRSSISTTVCSKNIAALLKTELCDKLRTNPLLAKRSTSEVSFLSETRGFSLERR